MTAPASIRHDRFVIAAYLLAEDIRKILATTLDLDRLTPLQKQRVMATTVAALGAAIDAQDA
jgi:hypothetical protein